MDALRGACTFPLPDAHAAGVCTREPFESLIYLRIICTCIFVTCVSYRPAHPARLSAPVQFLIDVQLVRYLNVEALVSIGHAKALINLFRLALHNTLHPSVDSLFYSLSSRSPMLHLDSQVHANY